MYTSTKEQLQVVELPKETTTYKPVSHSQLMDLTLESIYQSGFVLDKELYSSANDGRVANARYTIKNVADSEMQLQIGWQNSYDKSLSLKFAIGTRIMICQNGCVSGDYGAFKKKHRGQIQTFTPHAITEYIKQAGDAFRKMQEERETMKQIQMTKRTSAELIGRLYLEEEIIRSVQLSVIKKELSSPTHDYGAPGSLWELYQYTTFAMKDSHPSLWMNQHIGAHTFFVNNAGILVTATEEIADMPTPFKQLELNFQKNELVEVL
jgi:hypothetical protein